MDIFYQILEILYGWVNESWKSSIGLVLTGVGFILTGYGFWASKNKKEINGIGIMVFGVMIVLYFLGMAIYDPGLVTGKLATDNIVENVDNYRNASLDVKLFDCQFNVYDDTSEDSLFFANEIENIDKSFLDKIYFKHLESGNTYREYTIEKNAIHFPKVPAGRYEFLIKYDGYTEYLGSMNLDPSALNDTGKVAWEPHISLMRANSSSFYPFKVRLVDTNGTPLSNFSYRMGMQKDNQYAGITTDDSGFLKYSFEGRQNSYFYLSYDDPDTPTVSYTKKVEFKALNEDVIVVVDYNEDDKNAPGKIVNRPGMLDQYCTDFGYGTECYELSGSGFFESVSDNQALSMYEVVIQTDLSLQDKKIIISVLNGAGSEVKPVSDREIKFRASTGSYMIEVYDANGILINEREVYVDKSGTYSLNFISQ